MIKILAVDDEAGICILIKNIFEPMGFVVLTATTALDAIKIIKTESPKVVFLDIRMDDVSGLDILKDIKSIDNAIRVIILSALKEEDVKLKAKELGADEFITKPFMSETIEKAALHEIHQLLKQIETPRILIVDDETELCKISSEILLHTFVCEVDVAYNGEDALDKIKAKKYDVAILDIRMPGISGIDVIKQAVKISPETQLLAVSAYDSHEVVDKAIKSGAIDFIYKPQTTENLERKIRVILKKIGKYRPRKIQL